MSFANRLFFKRNLARDYIKAVYDVQLQRWRALAMRLLQIVANKIEAFGRGRNLFVRPVQGPFILAISGKKENKQAKIFLP